MPYLFPLHRGPLPDAVGRLYGWQITSYFGGRIDPLTGRPGNHGGMDLAYAGCAGQEMIAVADGRLVQSWDSSGGGRWSRLEADDGNVFGYGHADHYAAVGGVDPINGGQRRVKAGDVIAYVGTTGGSTGAHLHFAYKPKGSTVYADPFDLLMAAAAASEVPIPNTLEEIAVARGDLFKFPDGTTYVLTVAPTYSGFGWVWIGGPAYQADGQGEGLLSTKERPLARAGTEKDDALFGRHPVLSGPHKRDTPA